MDVSGQFPITSTILLSPSQETSIQTSQPPASTISHIIVTSLIRYDTNLCPMNIDSIDHQGLNLHLYRLYLSISNDYRCTHDYLPSNL